MNTKARVISILAILSITLACSVFEQSNPTPQTVEVSPPTVIVVVTSAPASTSTTEAPAQNGIIIYDDGESILSINPNTGESTVLISREELETALAKDRSADSYTYRYKKPLAITLSPDRSKALVTICADIDVRYRCLFSDYVYSLDSKTGIQLPVPPDAYGVYWQWSPDGSKLAGTAWSYDRALYFPTAFFAVNSDGTNLTMIGSVINDRWQFAWNPQSSAIHPLGYIVNFQSLFTDKSKPEDVPIAGLGGNDGIECLAFSPDDSQVAFSVRHSTSKNREGIYLANSDFSEVTQLTEYDIDSRYFCKVIWSPNGRFVHIRYEYDTRAETGENNSGPEPRKDKLVDVETGTSLETPRDLLVCGWTPENNLVYETKAKDGGLQILSPGVNSPVEQPAGMQSNVLHCPVLWLEE